MTSGPQLSFGNPELNAFLFASVGEDKSGFELTVLSALARLGLDPWGEAARLADLPREAAAQALAKTIALLPIGNWKAADSGDIATRLVGCLPRRGIPLVAPSPRSDRVGKAKTVTGPAVWLICAVLAMGWFLMLSHLQTAATPAPTPTTQQ